MRQHTKKRRLMSAPTHRTGRSKVKYTPILPRCSRSGNCSDGQSDAAFDAMAQAWHWYVVMAARTGRGDLAWWAMKIAAALRLINEMREKLADCEPRYPQKGGGRMNTSSGLAPIWAKIEVLPNFRETRPGCAVASCPGPTHKRGDRNPSLSIGTKDDGRVVFYCHVGCDAEEVRAALGADWRDFWPGRKAPGERRFQAKDRTGKSHGSHQRYYDDKGEKHGGWVNHDVGATQMPLYGADKLKDLPSGSRVFLVEGEPAAEALWKRNVAAVGTMTGASAIPCDDALRDLRKCVVIRWPDNDVPGCSHMEQISARFDELGIEHRRLHWPGAPPKGDAADYFAFGGTVEGLEAMIEVGEEEPPARHPSDVAAFPVEVLPRPMRDLVNEGAQAIICPPDFIAIPMLAAAGAAIGTTRCVEVKPGYRQFPSLRGVTIARAGERKSPACELAVAPIKERQNELAEQYKRELKEHQKQQDPQDPQEPEPVLEQLWISDTTLEALVDVLSQNRRGIAFLGDEISGWALAMNQYKGGHGADRKVWLEMHDCRSAIVNRRSRKGAAHLARPFVAVTGTIQPDILPELSDERGREDGFIHRILFSYPEPVEPERTEAVVSEKVRDAYAQLFAVLWRLDFDRDEDGALRPQVVKFTASGKAQWVEWVTDHYREVRAPRFPDNLRGPWAKLLIPVQVGKEMVRWRHEY